MARISSSEQGPSNLDGWFAHDTLGDGEAATRYQARQHPQTSFPVTPFRAACVRSSVRRPKPPLPEDGPKRPLRIFLLHPALAAEGGPNCALRLGHHIRTGRSCRIVVEPALTLPLLEGCDIRQTRSLAWVALVFRAGRPSQFPSGFRFGNMWSMLSWSLPMF